MAGHCVYAYGINLTDRYFYNEHSFFSSNDLLMADLFNGDVLSALKVYYEKVGDYDSLAWGGAALCKKIKEWGRQELLPNEALCNISATGLPQEDADKYHSS